MRFEKELKTNNKKFEDLDFGSIFEYCGSYYIKLFKKPYNSSNSECGFNCIALSKGLPCTMAEDHKVVQITGKFVRESNDYLAIIL